MVFRCFSVKKPGFDVEAAKVLRDLREDLGIRALTGVCIFNRYDVEGIGQEDYTRALTTVFSEPPCDEVFLETLPEPEGVHSLLAVESLPGQYDQRADSCAQCLQLLTQGERPKVSYASVYVLSGELDGQALARIEGYLINPVESRLASMDKPETLQENYPAAEPVGPVEGFCAADGDGLRAIMQQYGLAMDEDDIRLMQRYFRDEEGRDPTVTELKVVDTYWSDHCRHTTFGTNIQKVDIADEETRGAFEAYIAARREVYGEAADARPVTLMDMATIGAKTLKKRGGLRELDVSEEVNACSIHVEAKIDGKSEDWLLMFKNETHNHPTEIEPFGGAATCIGGAIRDPLSGRAYVYQAMRVTGAGDPSVPIEQTLPGKLPQRKLTTTAAAGYSSYGNQIGLATGLVHEVYHPRYVAKRMEVGAVVGAAPYRNVVREQPEPGDVIILLGGRTGRDGCGGATGSSKTHDLGSLSTCAAEVQKGNAPEERKLQRLFRNAEAARLIKRCNDFGAGGVSVAIGELADGVSIDLGAVKRKYEGLDGTELAISESQERMAVVVAPENAGRFMEMAAGENLEATVVAHVTEQARMVMWLDGRKIVDMSREFLGSNGATKYASVHIPRPEPYVEETGADAAAYLENIVSDLRFCSQRGLGERFDGSIGSGSVLMPYGGRTQRTPTQVMAALLPVLGGRCETCSVMSFAFDPWYAEKDGFRAARAAVITSVAKLVAAGCDYQKVYLTFQEYFERLRDEAERWGRPAAALLGALDAQLGLGIAAIGGKDSMSGSFMDLDVPPTLISFAIAPCEAKRVLSPELKAAGHPVYLFRPGQGYEALKTCWSRVQALTEAGQVHAAWAVTDGRVIGGLFKMAVGNVIGFRSENDALLLDATPGAIVAECDGPVEGAELLGYTTEQPVFRLCGRELSLETLAQAWEARLEDVFPTRAEPGSEMHPAPAAKGETRQYAAVTKHARPHAVIPAFPGTNCEYDTAAAVERAGGQAEIVVVRNITAEALRDSVQELREAIGRSQMMILPGGFSAGDEPEGSGKFIAAFLRNPALTDAVHDLLHRRDGLMLGICNGFQALIKLGLVPYGEIRDMDQDSPTLTFNRIGRHQSRYVTTRIESVRSPWLMKCRVGETYTVPISHGEGRFIATPEQLDALFAAGQVATRYVDENGAPTLDISGNPNGSLMGIEGILSADGRILGKMAHTERAGQYVAKNISGNLYQPIFEGGVAYFL